MKNITNYKRGAMISLVYVGACGLSLAQEMKENIWSDPVVVTASRIPEVLSVTTVQLITAEEIEDRQEDRLQDVLNLTSGALSTSTAGQEGQTGSLFLKGLPTNYNQILIDGVRVSEGTSSGSYGNLLGNFTFGLGEQLEVVTGSQGVFHGNAAIGGVIGIHNPFQYEKHKGALSQEVGSFEYTNTKFGASGAIDDTGYYITLGNQAYEQDLEVGSAFQVNNQQYGVGLETALNEKNKLRVTSRGMSSLVSKENVFFDTTSSLFSVQLLTDNKDRYKSVSVLSRYSQDYDSEDLNFSTPRFDTNLRKSSYTYDGQYVFSDYYTLKGGVEFSSVEYDEVSDFGGERETDWNTTAVYLDSGLSFSDFKFNAGVRGEYHSIYDGLLSAHLQTKYENDSNGVGVYARASVANRAPTLLESEAFPGVFGNQLSNPNLDKESVVSLEGGFSKKISSNLDFSVSGYAHFIQDSINLEFTPSFESQYQNADGINEVFGVDTTISGVLSDRFHYRLLWNYTLKNESLNSLPKGLPRNSLNADFYYKADKWLLGAGLTHRSEAGFGSARLLDANTIARLYGHYHILDNLKLSVRLENLLNEAYEVNPFAFDPVTFSSARGELGRGFATYVGLEASW